MFHDPMANSLICCGWPRVRPGDGNFPLPTMPHSRQNTRQLYHVLMTWLELTLPHVTGCKGEGKKGILFLADNSYQTRGRASSSKLTPLLLLATSTCRASSTMVQVRYLASSSALMTLRPETPSATGGDRRVDIAHLATP